VLFGKKEDSLYQIFTNLIFDSEKNAVEFINKEKSMRKNMIAEQSNMIINILKE
jgi:hypothetical protein